MHFNCKIVGAYWQDETGEWLVKIEETLPNGTKRLFEDRCHMFLHGTGALNNYKWPSLKGMDKFKGKIIHTANWPTDYEAEQWKDERVVVIGSGASSVQVVPKMQPHVEHMDIFIRTGVWFVALVDNVGANHEYTQEEKDEFRSDPSKLVAHAKKMDAGLNGLWGIFYRDSEKQAAARKAFGERMARIIKDERLLKGFTPTFEPNVTVNFTAVTEFTENGVIGGDGIERECDTIVCATGFDVSYRPRFPIVGKNGIDLVDKWKVCPEGYMGLMVPGFPNFVTFIGPNWPIQNGSAVGPLTAVTEYALQLIRRLQTGYVLGMSPRQDVTDEFNEHCQEWIKHTVWVDDCRSWYKNNETGRVNAVWPGSSVHYMDALKTPRYEDFEIDYFGPGKINRFAYLGMGTDKTLAEDGDTTYYFTHEKIDPEWQKAVGMPVTNSTTLA
ncbi:hypothetical protein SCUCBS95973_003016 [Sporothrix curviconia]|uniref:Uncharacterized protein n=1 Tax=Sporothrix curviconia TaxID=1260050 RepID=A0ABP0BBU8_9PEZI